jgi:3D (Asp-Asp-Asp) domain-containing protein
MSGKSAKRMRALESRVEDLQYTAGDLQWRMEDIEHIAWDTEKKWALKRANRAEREAERWRGVALGIALAAIVVEIIAVSVTRAKADEPTPDEGQAVLAAAEVLDAAEEEPPEANENQLIEAALLAKATRLDDVIVTYYDVCEACCGKADGITASGLQAVPGVTVAVDPDVIPLGSDVLVDYGDGEIQYYRADDTGYGVDGNAIDLCVATHEEALELGRRIATVYFVPPEG